MSEGDWSTPSSDEPAQHNWGLTQPNNADGTADNPVRASFRMLESRADAAMTYFYGQLFAMDHEIRAMFPAAMDQQRRRSFQALARIAQGAAAGTEDSAALDSYLQDLGRAHRKFGIR